jgi:DNA-binding transcriptional ArsR family regulator
MKTDSADLAWKALADPTRRKILDVLAKEPTTTGRLVDHFPNLCRTAVMKHMDVLQRAGLLVVRREGRVRWNHLNAMPIQRIYDRWVCKHIRPVTSALSRLKDHVEQNEREKTDER